MSDVTLTVAERVATLTLARAPQRNRLSLALMQALIETCGVVAERDDVRVAVIRGAGRDFSTGADLTDPGMRAIATAPLGERRRRLQVGPRLTAAIQAMPQTTIAAVHGHCLGGGAVVALACDLRVVGADLRFGLPEVLRGLNMSWHSVALLVAHFGPARTKELLVTARLLDAPTALAWGFANRTTGAGAAAVHAAADAWARELAATVPPIQAAMITETVNAIANAHTPMLHMDRDQFLLAQTSDDFREAIQAFLEKRPARFENR